MKFKRVQAYVSMLLLASFFSTSFLYGAENEYTVSALIDGDVTPPSIPTNVTADPVAPDQIDLAWDPSTDNFSLGGYQVFRDGLQVATTTLTTYSDNGLASSTPYAYFIRAFDSALNISGNSPTVIATTSAFVATSTPTTTVSAGGGSAVSLESVQTEITNLEVIVGEDFADVYVTTNVDTRLSTRWGRTAEYEMGYSAMERFAKTHRFRITDLTPHTVYELEILLGRRLDPSILTEHLQFTTLAGVDTEAPLNVSGLTAILGEEGVQIMWENPQEEDFSHVRVLGSSLFYPVNPIDGWFVYEGAGNEIFDERTIPDNSAVYYTVFTYDTSGNVSSGAVVRVQKGSLTDDVEATTTEISTFTLDDVIFIQSNAEIAHEGGEVELFAERITTIAIPYELLPEHLKTIVMTLTRRDDGTSFSFLLSINNDKTAYVARIGALAEAGVYDFTIKVFDYKTQSISSVPGTINAVSFEEGDSDTPAGISGIMEWLRLWPILISALLLLLLLLLMLLYKRERREDKPIENIV